MKILYIAKHDSGGNDDEGAITYSLEKLGHTVTRATEGTVGSGYARFECDFILFHKWDNPFRLSNLPQPKVFWYFDLVDYPDQTLWTRNASRKAWFERTLPCVQLGFCTDGDWVAKDTTGKLVLLRQGADERYVGAGWCAVGARRSKFLFTGISQGGGQGRMSFVNWMNQRYGGSFRHVRSGVHQRDLADLIASSRFVMAPDHPVTDNYWSNRVYLTCGFGGILFHKYARELDQHYEHEKEIIFYHDLADLERKITSLEVASEEYLAAIRERAIKRTLQCHTYTHRCEQLINVVKERVLS